MDQDITITFKKDESLSVTGNKFILSFNAPLIINKDEDVKEITIDLGQFKENISTRSFKNFIDASFGNQLNLDSREAYEIQFLCKKYENKSLLTDIDEFIKQIPEPQRRIMKFKLDEDQESLKYIVDHFPECIKCHEFMSFDPNFIITLLFSSEDFKKHIDSVDYQHSFVRYLVKVKQNKNQNLDDDSLLEYVNFKKLSPADITDIIQSYPDLKERASEQASSSIKTIHDIIEQGNQTLNSISSKLQTMIDEKNKAIKDINEKLDDIDKEKETLFSKINAQRTRIFMIDTQKNNLNVIQRQYNSVKTLYDKVTEYENRIEESFTSLNTRIQIAEGKSDQLVNKDSNE